MSLTQDGTQGNQLHISRTAKMSIRGEVTVLRSFGNKKDKLKVHEDTCTCRSLVSADTHTY